MAELTPKQVVAELDKYIISQQAAKRAVAIALRNRYRRSLLSEEEQAEVTPKNILMVGPTGVGKTEIARRLAKLVDAPFLKVEATKFTEVGYVGRDVESIVKDLVEVSIRMVKKARQQTVAAQAKAMAEEKLLDILQHGKPKKAPTSNPLQMIFGAPALPAAESETEEQKRTRLSRREELAAQLESGALEEQRIEIEVEDSGGIGIEIAGMSSEINMGEMFSGILPPKKKMRRVSVREARRILEAEAAEELVDMDEVIETAVYRAEQFGIIFLDEIDKVAGKEAGHGPDISREGVQRDILPLVEGSTVNTKYGPVKTDYMLFIAAGAFHVSRVEDLLPELQGRFPIRVQLDPLGKEEFEKILTQPENALLKQYTALLAADGVRLSFSADAISAIAEYADRCNHLQENLGARRLHTILEGVLEDISFNAGNVDPPVELSIDADYVRQHTADDWQAESMEKYIL